MLQYVKIFLNYTSYQCQPLYLKFNRCARWWFELVIVDRESLTRRTPRGTRRTLLTENGFEQLVEIGQRPIDRIVGSIV